jgi:mannose-1-phosphate guanylyltransferase/mannose-6-phosphate isomerase
VVLNDTTHKAYAGKTFEIPQETKHRIINDSDSQDLVFIEVTTGHFDENDIERFEDDFGRARGVV